jgi:hypothetical protein
MTLFLAIVACVAIAAFVEWLVNKFLDQPEMGADLVEVVNSPVPLTGEIMLIKTIGDRQSITLGLPTTNADLNAALANGASPSWSIDNTTLAAFVVAADAKTATLTGQGTHGVVNVTLSVNNADIDFSAQAQITLGPEDITNLDMTSSDPVDAPAAAATGAASAAQTASTGTSGSASSATAAAAPGSASGS